jgi:VanZ family protein
LQTPIEGSRVFDRHETRQVFGHYKVSSEVTNRAKKYVRWLFVVIWMGVIFAFSAQPHSGAVTEKYLGSANVPVRKASHMAEYAILFSLCRWAAVGTIDGVLLLRWLPLMISALYACSDEYHQSFVPGRSASGSDVLVDCSGACLAWLLIIAREKLSAGRHDSAVEGSK